MVSGIVYVCMYAHCFYSMAVAAIKNEVKRRRVLFARKSDDVWLHGGREGTYSSEQSCLLSAHKGPSSYSLRLLFKKLIGDDHDM